MEDVTIRRRNGLRHHYTIASNVLLFGYHHLSDAAKVTYLAVDSFDWDDGSGKRKGYAYPSLSRLAKDRGLDRRSIRRHLAELEAVGLVAREQRPGQPNLLMIEDPSKEETEKYIRAFENQGEDKIVLPTPDESVRPYKEEEREKIQNLINEDDFIVEGDRREAQEPERMCQTIRAMSVRPKHTSSGTEGWSKREYLAREMLGILKDEHSLGYYRKIAAEVPPQRIFEALSIVKQLDHEGRIRRSRGALFTHILKGPKETRSRAARDRAQP